jgi:hypothetical protein
MILIIASGFLLSRERSDRLAERVTAEKLGTWVDQRRVLADVLDTYGVALLS